MKKILAYLKEYQRKHFDLKLYLLTGLFLAVCFVFNYSYNFEDDVIDAFRGQFVYGPVMLVWMAFPFLGVCFILCSMGKNKSWLTSGSFWLKVLIGFSILALDRTFDVSLLLREEMPRADRRFIGKCLNWSESLLLMVLPLVLVYLMLQNDKPKTYYGLAPRRFDPKPYLALLGIAVVCIGIGSFFSDIQAYYPRFRYSGGERFAHLHDIPGWFSLLMYELAYGSDFIAVEVFFRGFLIHAFAKALGGYAVLPMVGSYAFLHFGKPVTEAISSVFGGYILGVISYYSKNVWGGIIIHIGVAWTMELFGYLQGKF